MVELEPPSPNSPGVGRATGAEAPPAGGDRSGPRGLLAVRLPLGGRAAAAAAGLALALMALTALLAPWLAAHDPAATDTGAASLPPGAPGHLLGTDPLGRDVAARMLYGARSSLLVGVVAGFATVVLGTALGALAAVAPGPVDALITRTADAVLALPLVLVAMALAAVAGSSFGTVVAAIAATAWMPVALIARAEITVLRERPFVRAARGLGLSRTRVLTRHLLPGALPPIAAIAAFEVGHAILTESTLSFLGIGIPVDKPSWGGLLADARSEMLSGQWYAVAFPAAAIVVTIIAVNVLATGFDRHEAAAGRTW